MLSKSNEKFSLFFSYDAVGVHLNAVKREIKKFTNYFLKFRRAEFGYTVCLLHRVSQTVLSLLTPDLVLSVKFSAYSHLMSGVLFNVVYRAKYTGMITKVQTLNHFLSVLASTVQ